MNQRLGVIIPYFSHWPYLEETLESLLNQTYRNWEAVVINDSGSPLPTKQVSRICSDARITLLENADNLGLARTWNRGVAHFLRRGADVVSIVHADDVLHRDFLLRSAEAHQRHPECALVHTAVSVINGDGRPSITLRDTVKRLNRPRSHHGEFFTSGDQGLAKLLRANYIFCPTISFKARVLRPNFFDESLKMVLDLDVTTRLLLDGEQFVGLTKRVYRYRRHASSLTAHYTRDAFRFEEEHALYSRIAVRAQEIGFHRTVLVAQRQVILRIHKMIRAFGNVLCRG